MNRWINAMTLIVCVAFLSGCFNDAETICEKADECNILVGQSVEECVEDVEKQGTDSEIEDCATCAEEKSCGSIVAQACDSECRFLFTN